MTNDVEHQSIALNREDNSIPSKIYKEGLPRLLDVFSRHDIRSTFYFTGMFAESSPESLELVKDYGHEIGCHGYDHSPSKAFDVLDYNQQIIELKKAKNAIEPVVGKISSFRAPALRINSNTIKALEEMKFTNDSSVSSQRFDGPFTFGSKKKLKWLAAPRNPYYMSYESPFKKGMSKILEIPVSAAVIPYIGTTMRASPTLLKFVEKYLFYEAANREKPVVFLFHPNECLDYTNEAKFTRRSSNIVEFVFADLIRHKLKQQNLGINSVKLLDQLLTRAKANNFEFLTMTEYERTINK